jgi:hypothetical protein
MGPDWYGSFALYQPTPHPIVFPLADPSSTESVAQDLETFAKHAGRTTVTTDDVLLITRRNDALRDVMKDFIDKEKTPGGKRKRK